MLKSRVAVISNQNQFIKNLEKLVMEYYDFEVIHLPHVRNARNNKIEVLVIAKDQLSPEEWGIINLKKNKEHVFVLFIVSDSRDEYIISLLNSGADFVVESTRSPQLVATQIKSFVEKLSPRFKNNHDLYFKNILFNQINHSFYQDDKILQLTNTETDILKFLLLRKNKVIERSDLEEALWGSSQRDEKNLLNQYLFRLRQKLNEVEIIVERNKGVSIK